MNVNETGPPVGGGPGSGPNVNEVGPPIQREVAPNASVNETGPPIQGTPLSRLRDRRRLPWRHPVRPVQSGPSTPV